MNVLINKIINELLNPLIFLFFALAAVYFLFGLIKFIINADDSTKRADGRKHMIYGIIGLIIMTGAKGILEFVDNTYEQVAPGVNTTLDEYRLPSAADSTD